jgi:heterodisulfide reductase subunit C
VDTASALTLLQEAELGKSKSRPQVKDSFRSSFKNFGDKVKVGDADKPKQQTMLTEFEDKLANLKNFRRRNGLCFKCGNKWSKDHKCPHQVPLHVIEELLDALEAKGLDDSELDSKSIEETVMAVGHSSLPDPTKRRTMKLCGKIGKKEVLILVDSGSVASFISTQLADQLQVQTIPCQQTSFVAADGSPMICNKQI